MPMKSESINTPDSPDNFHEGAILGICEPAPTGKMVNGLSRSEIPYCPHCRHMVELIRLGCHGKMIDFNA